MILSDKVYNFIKWLVMIALPAFGTAYISASKFVDIPNPEAVAGLVIVISTFLGTIVGISNFNYKKVDNG